MSKNDVINMSQSWQDFVLLQPDGIPRDVSALDFETQNLLLANSIFFGNAIHSFVSDRTEQNLAAAAKIGRKVSDEGDLYLNVAQGFKAGGFNVQQTGDDFSKFEFEDETALTVELGGKFSLADGAARFNFALFNTAYDDLQVSIFNGVGFDVPGIPTEIAMTRANISRRNALRFGAAGGLNRRADRTEWVSRCDCLCGNRPCNLRKADRAASTRSGSPTCSTSRRPRTRASSSSSVNPSGGKAASSIRVNPNPAAPSITAPRLRRLAMSR